jgi:hypothetical protein
MVSGANGAATRAAPPLAVITPELIERTTHHPGPITIKEAPVSGACDANGKRIWSVVADAADGTFRALTISLLQGGSFLSEERIGNLEAAQKETDDIRRAMQKQLQKQIDDNIEALQKEPNGSLQMQKTIEELGKPRDNLFLHRINGKGFTGYAMVLGIGPGGSSSAASVFSSDRQYEIQVEVDVANDVANYGSRFHATEETKEYAQRIRSPLPVISDVAIEIASRLFGDAR